MIDAYIVADRLDEGLWQEPGSGRERLNLRGVRLHVPEDGRYEKGYLYVVDEVEIADARPDQPATALAVVGAEGAAGAPASPCCISDSHRRSCTETLAAIQRVFEEFEDARNDVIRMVIDGLPIQLILERCAKLLGNPFAIFDTSFVAIGHAGEFEQDRSDTIWDIVLDKGFTPAKNLDSDIMKTLLGSDDPVVMTNQGVKLLGSCIRHGDTVVGFFGMTALNEEIDEAQISTASWIVRILGDIWPWVTRTKDEGGLSEQTVLRLLDGYTISDELVVEYLDRKGWKIDDPYRMLYLYRGIGGLDKNEYALLVRTLRQIYPDRIVVTHGDGIAVIERRDEPSLDEPVWPKEEFLRQYDLLCAASMQVERFTDIRAALRQCKIVQRRTEHAAAGTCTRFTDVFKGCVLDALDEECGTGVLCHPRVRALADRPHGMDFVHSLRVYLEKGRNMSHAAEALYVHRNTMVYRIEQVERWLGLNLDEADHDLLFQLYVSCLLVEHDRGEM